jgi:hypothetical protein
MRGAGFVPSLYHAEPIPGESPFADRTNGVHYYDNLVVLHTATQPAVLLEAARHRQPRRGAGAPRPAAQADGRGGGRRCQILPRDERAALTVRAGGRVESRAVAEPAT